MNKIKLLLIVPTLHSGGQERVAVNTAAVLSEYCNITMVVFEMDKAVYKPECEVIDINIPAADGYWNKICNVIKRIRALKKLKRELRVDVSISFGGTANLANVLSRVSDKIIVSIRGYGALSGSGINKAINKLVYRSADIVVCVAEKMTKDLVAFYPGFADKVVTLYNPYDFDSITKQAGLPIALTIRHPAVVTMGRLEKVKGYRHLLKAFALVQHELPEATLVFLGEGGERENLESLASDLGLADNVTFLGFQANPFSYLARCKVYVLSSIYEGFPNALVEAMSCALPVLATDCNSGPREILTETDCDSVTEKVEYAKYGILIPPFTADDSSEPELEQIFADAILRLLKDEEFYKQYREKAQERARVFSVEAYKNKLIKIIEG